MPEFRSVRSFGPAGHGSAPGGGGGGGGPIPQSNPWAKTVPGVYVFGVPAGVSSITIEQWGGGGGGAKGVDADTGGAGGGGGAYAKLTYSGPLVATGALLTVIVGAGGAADAAGASATNCKSSMNPAVYVMTRGGHGGASDSDGGDNSIEAGSGMTVVTNTNGTAGGMPVGKSGESGGKGANGGAGGAGGGAGVAGVAGVAPGGGGGGGGAPAAAGAAGAAGKVSISW